jgi:hypothetical protein
LIRRYDVGAGGHSFRIGKSYLIGSYQIPLAHRQFLVGHPSVHQRCNIKSTTTLPLDYLPLE